MTTLEISQEDIVTDLLLQDSILKINTREIPITNPIEHKLNISYKKNLSKIPKYMQKYQFIKDGLWKFEQYENKVL